MKCSFIRSCQTQPSV